MERETCCINTKAILDYFNEYHNGDCHELIKDLHPEIDFLPDPERFLSDPNNWVSCAVLTDLYKRTCRLLDDEIAPYKIAKYAVENSSLGYVQRIFVKGFWSYKTGLKHVQKINDKLNRSKRVELVRIDKNEAVIRLHWDPSMQLSKHVCLYNQGVYTYLPLVWNGSPLSLKENCCYFEDAPYCEYYLKWPKRNRFYEISSSFFTTKSVLMDTITEMEQDKLIIQQKYDEVNRLNTKLNQKIEHLLAIQETGKAILSVLDLEQLLTVTMNILFNVCRISRAIVMLTDESQGVLEYIYSVGFGQEVPPKIKEYKVPLSRLSNIMVRVTHTGQPEYIPDVKSSNLRKENVMLLHGKPTSVFVVPLITRSKVIGIIATDAINGNGISEETREILEIFASQIAIAIENAKLYRQLQEQMEEQKRSHALLSRAEKFSFLGNLAARLAHEIKNPMTAIGTFIQMLPKKYDDEEFRTGFYEIAMEETNRVNNLITELLDLVKTRESFFDLNDLHELIDKMVLLISPQSNLKKIRVVRQFDPEITRVWMDTEKIKQTILNILANAVDYTPQKGEIRIITRYCKDRKHSGIIHIEIKDNGPGIDSSMIENIFDPYFTTKHKSSMHNGTGLGLFIAHQNVQDHDGTIDVVSSPGKGAEFRITLPTNPPSSSAA